MTPHHLLMISGSAAIIGGGLRVIAAFIPWQPGDVLLETFYAGIDVALLAGLIGIYVARSSALGVIGFVGFGIAFVGQALIVGPDDVFLGVDMYEAGIAVIATGLVILSCQIIRTQSFPNWIPALWIAAPLMSVGSGAAGFPDQGFFAAGFAYGLAFVGAGSLILSETQRQMA